MIMDPPAGLWLARSRAKSHLIGSNCINQIKSDKNNINYMMDSRILEVELCLFFIFFSAEKKDCVHPEHKSVIEPKVFISIIVSLLNFQ